jgi:hypothetical protein
MRTKGANMYVPAELRDEIKAIAEAENRPMVNTLEEMVELYKAVNRPFESREVAQVRRTYVFGNWLACHNRNSGTKYRPSTAPVELVEEYLETEYGLRWLEKDRLKAQEKSALERLQATDNVQKDYSNG